MRRWLTFTPFDGLLLLMVLIWGANYSVVKSAIREIPPQAFNVLRMGVASAVFAAAIFARGLPRVARADWARLALLGTIGHFVYQVCFMAGLSRTTASNSSLIIGCSPVAVSMASALAGHERVPRAQWVGVLLSVLGVYLVVGHRRRVRRELARRAICSPSAPSAAGPSTRSDRGRCWPVTRPSL